MRWAPAPCAACRKLAHARSCSSQAAPSAREAPPPRGLDTSLHRRTDRAHQVGHTGVCMWGGGVRAPTASTRTPSLPRALPQCRRRVLLRLPPPKSARDRGRRSALSLQQLAQAHLCSRPRCRAASRALACAMRSCWCAHDSLRSLRRSATQRADQGLRALSGRRGSLPSPQPHLMACSTPSCCARCIRASAWACRCWIRSATASSSPDHCPQQPSMLPRSPRDFNFPMCAGSLAPSESCPKR